MKKVILPISLILVTLLVAVFGTVMFNKVQASYEELDLLSAINETYPDFTHFEKSEAKLQNDKKTKSEVTEAYVIYNGEEVIGYLYYAQSVSYSTKESAQVVKVLVGIGADKKMTLLEVISTDPNDYYNQEKNVSKFEKLINNIFKDKVTNKTYLEKVTGVSNATLTTNAIKNAVKIARTQFYKDINEKLPVDPLKVTLVSSTQDTTDLTKFTAVMNFQSETYTTAVELTATLTVDYSTMEVSYSSGTIAGAAVELADKEKEAVVKAFSLPKTPFFASIDETTRTYQIVTTETSFGSVVLNTIVLDADNKVVSYTTQGSVVGGGYNESSYDFDSFRNNTVGQDVANVDKLTGVSGVTLSSNALKSAFTFLAQYLAGGNN